MKFAFYATVLAGFAAASPIEERTLILNKIIALFGGKSSQSDSVIQNTGTACEFKGISIGDQVVTGGTYCGTHRQTGDQLFYFNADNSVRTVVWGRGRDEDCLGHDVTIGNNGVCSVCNVPKSYNWKRSDEVEERDNTEVAERDVEERTGLIFGILGAVLKLKLSIFECVFGGRPGQIVDNSWINIPSCPIKGNCGVNGGIYCGNKGGVNFWHYPNDNRICPIAPIAGPQCSGAYIPSGQKKCNVCK